MLAVQPDRSRSSSTRCWCRSITARSRPRSARSISTSSTSDRPSGSSRPDGEAAHTACLGFGLERVVMALFKAHGFKSACWPDGRATPTLALAPATPVRSAAALPGLQQPTTCATRCMRPSGSGSRRTATSTSGSSFSTPSDSTRWPCWPFTLRDRLRGRPVDLLQAAPRGPSLPLRRRRSGDERLAAAARSRGGAAGGGPLISTEADAFWLPDTAGTDYRRQHTKTTIILGEIDLAARQRWAISTTPAITFSRATTSRSCSGSMRPPDPAFMPLYAELVRHDRAVRARPGALRAASRRAPAPGDRPPGRRQPGAQISRPGSTRSAWLAGPGVARLPCLGVRHAASARAPPPSSRRCTSAGSNPAPQSPLQPAAEALMQMSTLSKALILKAARAVNAKRRRPRRRASVRWPRRGIARPRCWAHGHERADSPLFQPSARHDRRLGAGGRALRGRGRNGPRSGARVARVPPCPAPSPSSLAEPASGASSRPRAEFRRGGLVVPVPFPLVPGCGRRERGTRASTAWPPWPRCG